MHQLNKNVLTISNEKITAYQNAFYSVNDLFSFTVGSLPLEIKTFLNGSAAVFITPCNPFGIKISDAENNSLVEEFGQYLRNSNAVHYLGSGSSQDKLWAEKSFFIVDPSKKIIDMAFEKYKQDAYIYIDDSIDLVCNV
jgi:hypothetical protein